MRTPAVLIIGLVLLCPAAKAEAATGGFSSVESVIQWINLYRAKPEPVRLPAAVKTLSTMGAFRDPEASGLYVGFIAGVIGSNPATARKLIGKMLPLPQKPDEWVLVRAIAYSGRPDSMGLLAEFAHRMPARAVMIDKHIAGELPTLDEIMADRPAPKKKFFGFLRKKPVDPVPLPTPDTLDTVWGYYLATGSTAPIERLIAILPWSKDDNDLAKLTLGGMSKYMLASSATRDAKLLAVLKELRPGQSKETGPILDQVIAAAETVEAGRIRSEQLAAIDDLKAKGPGYARKVAWWGKLGEGAIAVGCVAAAVAGQVQLGIPCVVGGAVSSAALKFWASG